MSVLQCGWLKICLLCNVKSLCGPEVRRRWSLNYNTEKVHHGVGVPDEMEQKPTEL